MVTSKPAIRFFLNAFWNMKNFLRPRFVLGLYMLSDLKGECRVPTLDEVDKAFVKMNREFNISFPFKKAFY